MSSAICFSLDQSKILSFGMEFIVAYYSETIKILTLLVHLGAARTGNRKKNRNIHISP